MAQPATEPAETLANIWSAVLGVDRVEAADNFFALGGESLAAASILIHIGQTLGVEVSLRDFYRDGTFGAGLERVRQALATRSPRKPQATRPPGGVRPQAGGPSSIAQEWLLNMSEQPSQEGMADFLVQQAITLQGPVDADRVRHALNAVADRHELLRVGFVRENGTVRLRIAPEARIELRQERIAGAARGAIAAATAQGFDRYAGPMARCHLFELGPHTHILVFVLDHIIADGVSLGILLRDFSAAYAGAELPPVAMPFTVWSAAQRRIDLDTVRDYWADRLGDDPTILTTPFREYRAVQMERSAGTTLTLTSAQSQAVRTAASRRSLTVYSLILGAFLTALRDRVTRPRFCVATTIANRSWGTEDTFGPLAHDAYVPVDLDAGTGVAALARQAQEATAETTAHGVVPNTTILDLLWPGVSDRLVEKPAFYFGYNARWSESFHLPGVRSADLQTVPYMPMPGLECTVVDGRERITVHLRYLAGAFPPGYVEALGAEVVGHLDGL